MKNISIMSLVLALVGLNLYGSQESKPTPSPAPTPTLAETVGKTASKAGTDLIKGLGGTAATTAAAAAGIPPLNLNLNIDTKIIKCNDGDNISTVNGDNNQIQNIRGNCDQRIGATGDIVKFTLPSSVVTVNQTKDIVLQANTAYNFIFNNGRESAALAARVSATVSGLVVTIYTTRAAARDRWTERYRFGVEGDGSKGIAPMRVHSNGMVEIFFPDPIDPTDSDRALRLKFDVLDPFMAV